MRVASAALALVAVVVVACAAPPPLASSPTPAPSPSEPPPPPASVSPTIAPTIAPASPHVFVIVMENTNLAEALRSPSVERLAAKYVLATNYHAVSSPSLPNYLAMTSGSTWGITDDGYHVLPPGGLGAQLTAAGLTWRAYMEGLT